LIAMLVLVAICAAGAMGAQQQIRAAGSGYREVGHWGKHGLGNGQFGSNALGLATDSKTGTVYVADTDQHRLQAFSARGRYLRQFTFPASASVRDVAVDPDGNIWGTDQQGYQAQQFSKGGELLASFLTPKLAEGLGVDAKGNVYATTHGDGRNEVIRYDKSAAYAAGVKWAGFQSVADVEVSPDGSVYVVDDRLRTVKRFGSNGRLLNTIRGGISTPIGIGVDLDCNILLTNIAQRNVGKFSPTGRPLGTIASEDLQAQDVAVGPKSDLYMFDGGKGIIVHFAEDRSKPAPATIGAIRVSALDPPAGWIARLKFTAAGIACPAEIDATASLDVVGGPHMGTGSVQVQAGKATEIEFPLVDAVLRKLMGKNVTATFKIVLETNGRKTTQVARVQFYVQQYSE
jgi:tripartite motif-containing protein 2/3/potassium/chloride transporter 8